MAAAKTTSSTKTWKVRLHVVNTNPTGSQKPADHVDTFGVEAGSHDRAKEAARKWLRDRKYTIRAINFTPNPRELIAYVLPQKKELARA